MSDKRVTIMITDENLKLIRNVQSKLIKQTNQNWSFSKTLKLVLSIGLGTKDFNDLIQTVIEITKREIEKVEKK